MGRTERSNPLRIYPLAAALAMLLASSAAGAPITVFGWTLPDSLQGEAPPLELGDEPVVGRLACPAVAVLDLESKKAIGVVIRSATASSSEKGATWTYELRSGIYWWSGKEVSAADFAEFLQQTLPRWVKERGQGLWKAPPFEVAVAGPHTVKVEWGETPVFGPYLLTGVPLYRAVKEPVAGRPRYECAGLYALQTAPFGLRLVPTPGYGRVRPEVEVWTGKPSADYDNSARARIEFRYGADYGGSPWARPSDEAADCKQTIDLPVFTAILWNPQGRAADPKLRQALTMLTPRGALVRSGAAYLGTLATGIVPPNHPGADGAAKLRPHDAQLASKTLTTLGFRRPRPDGPRLDGAGKPLELSLYAPERSSGLVEKILIDSFSLVGIKLNVTQDAIRTKPVDGVLAGIRVNWPRVDLLPDLHSRATGPLGLWPLQDEVLDRHLEAYALELTKESPDFTKLAAVHKRLYDLEPFTVLLQHKACVITTGKQNQKLSTKDPDWFRDMVL